MYTPLRELWLALAKCCITLQGCPYSAVQRSKGLPPWGHSLWLSPQLGTNVIQHEQKKHQDITEAHMVTIKWMYQVISRLYCFWMTTALAWWLHSKSWTLYWKAYYVKTITFSKHFLNFEDTLKCSNQNEEQQAQLVFFPANIQKQPITVQK